MEYQRIHQFKLDWVLPVQEFCEDIKTEKTLKDLQNVSVIDELRSTTLKIYTIYIIAYECLIPQLVQNCYKYHDQLSIVMSIHPRKSEHCPGVSSEWPSRIGQGIIPNHRSLPSPWPMYSILLTGLKPKHPYSYLKPL